MRNALRTCDFRCSLEGAPCDQQQHCQIADFAPDLPEICTPILLFIRRSENTLESDFVKHSSSFGARPHNFGHVLKVCFWQRFYNDRSNRPDTSAVSRKVAPEAKRQNPRNQRKPTHLAQILSAGLREHTKRLEIIGKSKSRF